MSWLLLLLSFAQAKKQKTPCWISQQCDPYSAEEYMIGIGSGDSIEQADNAAMGAISKQFVANIEQIQISQKELSETSRQNKSVSALEHQSLRTQTSVNTTMQLKGVQIAERFHDQQKDQSRHYSLAIISKDDWLQRITQERAELRDEMERLLFQIQKTEHVLDRLPYYEQIFPLIAQEKGLIEREKIIKPDGSYFPATTTRTRIEEQQARDRKDIYFVVVPGEASELAEEALTNLGFIVKPSISTPEAAISIRLQSQRTISSPDAYGFITAKANTELLFSIPSRELMRIKQVSSSSSKSAQTAEDKLDYAIISDIQALLPQIEALLQGEQ